MDGDEAPRLSTTDSPGSAATLATFLSSLTVSRIGPAHVGSRTSRIFNRASFGSRVRVEHHKAKVAARAWLAERS